MKKYERLADDELSPLKFECCAFGDAMDHYAKLKGVDFLADLFDYLVNGFVVSRPTVFAMGKLIEKDGKRGWFIRYACGNILELLSLLPCRMDYIYFCRTHKDNDRVLRRCSWDAFVRRATVKVRAECGRNDVG